MRNFLAIISILILISSCLSKPESASGTEFSNEEKTKAIESEPVGSGESKQTDTEDESEIEAVYSSKISDEKMVEYNKKISEIGFEFPQWDGFDRSVYIMETQVTPEEKGDNIWVDFQIKNRSPSDFLEIDRKLIDAGINEIFAIPSAEYIFSRFGQPRMMGFHTNPWVDGYFLKCFYGDVLIWYDPSTAFAGPDEIHFSGNFYTAEFNSLFRTGQTFEEILSIFPEVETEVPGVMPNWENIGVLYRDYWSEGNGYLLLEEGLAVFFDQGGVHSVRIKKKKNGEIPHLMVRIVE